MVGPKDIGKVDRTEIKVMDTVNDTNINIVDNTQYQDNRKQEICRLVNTNTVMVDITDILIQ
jgi:hypothetical protein